MFSFLQNKDRSFLIILIYGFVAALTYDCVAKTFKGFPLLSLPILVGISLIFVLPFASIAGILRELNKNNFLRPFLFTLGQLLVVASLSFGSPFATFVSTGAGTIFAILAGKFFLRERISLLSFIGVTTTLSGVFLINQNFNLPILALVAGLIQGSAVFLARKRAVQGAYSIDMASASLLLLFIVSLPVSFYFFSTHISQSSINWTSIFVSGAGFAFLQSAYCYLARRNEGWMLSLIGNTRIPASVLISGVLATQAFSWRTMGLGVMVFAGIVLAYLGMKKV